MTNCSNCSKKLGLMSIKHKLEDGTFICGSCFNRIKVEDIRKRENIMLEYIGKYIDNYETSEEIFIIDFGAKTYLDAEMSAREKGDYVNLDTAISDSETKLREVESSFDKNTSIEGKSGEIANQKIALDFLKSIKKLQKLFEMKKLSTDITVILSLLLQITQRKLKEFDEKEIMEYYENISEKHREDITIEIIIKEYFKKRFSKGIASTNLNLDSYFTKVGNVTDVQGSEYKYNPKEFNKNDFENIIKLIKKFTLSYENDNLKEIIIACVRDHAANSLEDELFSKKKDNVIPDLKNLDGYEFESFLGNLFRKMGYSVINTKLSGDQGADIIIEKNGEKTAVQAKCYSDPVGNKAIQEVVASKNHYGCHKAMVVATNGFTRSAFRLADSNGVELWDKNKLDEIIREIW